MQTTSPDFSESSFSVSDEELFEAAGIIRKGGIVAFPTETSYGLAVDPCNNKALEKLFSLKMRDRGNPVLVLIAKVDVLPLLVKEVPDLYRKIIAEFWPGPLTLVFAGQDNLPDLLTDARGTIGVRLSSHPVARRLAGAVGGVITGTSANPSGLPAATTFSQVKEMFPDGIDHIIDGGPVPGGPGSSIIGVSADGLGLIRKGSINFEDIIAAVSDYPNFLL